MRLINTIIVVLFLAPSVLAVDLGEDLLIPRPYRIDVIPGRDTLVRAGESIFFRAVGYDSQDNVIRGLSFTWSLAPSADTIGYMIGSTFTATKVGAGRVQAVAQGVTGQSGLITVRHGDLSRIFLDLSPVQLAGLPLITSAEVIFYDAFDNLMIDYSVGANPVTLVTSIGQLRPDIIADNSLQIGGVLRLLPVGVQYLGGSALTNVHAVSGGVESQTVEASFNGYDLTSATNVDGSPIEVIYHDVKNPIRVIVGNKGTLSPTGQVRLTAGYESGGAVVVSFNGGSNGHTDTLLVRLPVHDEPISDDVILLHLEADFFIDGRTYTTVDSADLPVRVIHLSQFAVRPESVKPDSIYPGEPFLMSFEVAAPSFTGPIDSTVLSIDLAEQRGGSAVVNLYAGRPTPQSLANEIIRYADLEGSLSPAAQIRPGWYALKFSYRLYSGGLGYTLEDNYPDSVHVLPEIGLTYAAGTLGPMLVYAGGETSFDFVISLESDFPVKIYPELSSLTVTGADFRTSTSLALPATQLVPGNNRLESQKVFIPESQLGGTLLVSASITYSVVTETPSLAFSTDFNAEKVTVQERPVVQIVSTDVEAPNKPKVNTGQAFHIVCRVANRAGHDTGPVTLSLTSDGQSSVQPEVTVPNIPEGQTVEVHIDVVAARDPSAAEVFRVEILSDNVAHLPHIDNTALVEIERPAELVLTYDLLGLEKKIIPRGREFGLVVEIVNVGDAHVTDGKYLLTTGGVDFGDGDSLAGSFSADQHLNFTFRAPSFDTTVTFRFVVVEMPQDMNSLQPAGMAQQSFAFEVRVETLDADLVIEPALAASRLVVPGRREELFTLSITNIGLSANTRTRLEEVSVLFTNQDQQPVSAGSLIIAGQTGFFEDGRPVSVTATGDNRAVLTLENFVVEPSQTRVVRFEAVIKPIDLKSFNVGLDRTQIKAVFVQGPHQGMPPKIVSTVEDRYLVNAAFALKGEELQASLAIQDNPFDPAVSPAVLSYELSQPSTVEFRIFTLSGEEVYAKDFPEGSAQGATGENSIQWDGRNNRGELVMNGVYVCSIKVVKTGQTVRTKLALVK